MIIFQNPGAINLLAAVTLGVNVKPGSNAIGVFGTGLKYAIATILRLGGSITIYRGKKRYDFTSKKQNVREVPFHFVYMNSKQLGFTTHLGGHWQAWEAYRELYSNAKDEGGVVVSTTNPAYVNDQLKANHTLIVVTCAEIEAVHAERHKYFLETSPMHVLKGVDVHAGETTSLFYKGIKVYDHPKTAKYTYSLNETEALTEDRTLRYPTLVNNTIAKAIIRATDKPFLFDVLSAKRTKDRLEEALPYQNLRNLTPSTEFMLVADELKNDKDLNGGASQLFRHYQDTLPGYVSPYIVEMDEVQRATVQNALNLLAQKGVTLPDGAQIQVKSKTELHKVQVAKRYITLDAELLTKGHAQLAERILEGVAMWHGGSVVEQLTHFCMAGSFIDRELTQGYSANSAAWDEEVTF